MVLKEVEKKIDVIVEKTELKITEKIVEVEVFNEVAKIVEKENLEGENL